MSVRPGFEGLVRIGTWLPVEIEVANRGPDISGDIVLQVDGGSDRSSLSTPSVIHTQPASLPRFSNKRFRFEVYVPTIANRVSARLVANGDILLQREVPLETVPSGELLCGVLSRNATSLDFISTIGLTARQRSARLAHLDVSDLPAHAQALSALDCLVVSNPATGNTSDDQKSALASWVASGGLLVVAGGQNWQKTVAQFPAELLPVRVTNTTVVPSLGSLVAFGGQEITDPGPWLASDATVADGTVIVAEGDLPILVGARRGAGSVFYLALDPAAEPLRSWAGSEYFWRYVLSNVPAAAASPSAPTRQYSGWGRIPRLALGDFSNAETPDGRLIGLLLLGYLVLLAPVSYFLLRRMRRLELSAIVSIILVGATSAASFGVASADRNADLLVNHVTIVRAWSPSLPAQAHSFVSLYNPKALNSEIAAPQGTLLHSLSAPQPRPVGREQSEWALEVTDGTAPTIRNYDLPAGTIGTFSVDSQVEPVPLTGSIVITGNHLKGTITNSSTSTLRDAAAIIGREVVKLGTLQPKQSREMEFDLTQSIPAGYLDVTSIVRDLFADQADDRSAEQRTVRDVVDSALGASYSYYARVDLSAVTLLAWIDQDTVPLQVHGAKTVAVHHTLLVQTFPIRFARGEHTRIPQELIERRPMSVVAGGKLQSAVFTMAPGDTTATEYSLPALEGQFDVDYLAVAVEGQIGNGRDDVTARALGAVAIFDWRKADWTELTLALGENAIPNPQRFISPLGTVRVRYSFRPPPELNQGRFEVSRFDLVVGGRGR